MESCDVCATRLAEGCFLTLADRIVLHLRRIAAGDVAPLRKPPTGGIFGVSPAAAELRNAIGRAARMPDDVLILGPTGAGKELVAREIHLQSARASAPWVARNMAAIPEELAAASLFGSRKGAFTGADSHRKGFFQQAAGGTLFLFEICDSPLAIQPLLLRAL